LGHLLEILQKKRHYSALLIVKRLLAYSIAIANRLLYIYILRSW